MCYDGSSFEELQDVGNELRFHLARAGAAFWPCFMDPPSGSWLPAGWTLLCQHVAFFPGLQPPARDRDVIGGHHVNDLELVAPALAGLL